MTSFDTTLEKFSNQHSKVYQLHFPIPDRISKPFMSNENKRVKCLINNKVELRSGLMPQGDYWYLICNNRIQKKLGIKVGDKVTIAIEKDDSKYGMDIPEELEVMLDQDQEAGKIFESLTPGKQRSLIYLVNKLKYYGLKIHRFIPTKSRWHG